jgi:hypothetical protein
MGMPEEEEKMGKLNWKMMRKGANISVLSS